MKLPTQICEDLQLRQIFSETAVNMLLHPCDKAEIFRRQILFSQMQSAECYTKITACIAALRAYRRALELWRTSSHRLERHFTFAALLRMHATVCEKLTAIADYSEICAEFAATVHFPPKSPIKSIEQQFLISFSDKNWITPDGDFADEFDEISVCATNLGLSVPSKKTIGVKADESLSNAICRLFAEDAAALDVAMESYGDVNWNAPLDVLCMLEFFDEIYTLVKNAASHGVPYCIPRVSEHRQYIARDLCNVTLLSKHCNTIVPNDVQFTESEPFFFLIGANGGGKTTYLRTVGMNLLLYLAGCPIFARDALIYPFKALLTHFPADEQFNDTGRLDEELIRANQMLADSDVFLLFNETFSGADSTRGFALLMQTAKAIRTTGQFGLYVTHFHKVKESEFPLLSAQVDIEDANRRTYRIVRAYSGVSSYSEDILRKYRLDRKSLDERRKNDTQSVVSE